MVERAIHCAISFGSFKNIFLSTESEEIAAYGKAYDINVLNRPSALARDEVKVAEVIFYDLEKIRQNIGPCGIIAILLPTSPFRKPADIEEAVNLLNNSGGAVSLVSISPFSSPIQHALEFSNPDKYLTPYYGYEFLNEKSQRQEHPQLYFPNGCINLIKVSAFEQHQKVFIKGKTIGFETDFISSIDIDTPEDLKLAEIIEKGMNL